MKHIWSFMHHTWAFDVRFSVFLSVDTQTVFGCNIWIFTASSYVGGRAWRLNCFVSVRWTFRDEAGKLITILSYSGNVSETDWMRVRKSFWRGCGSLAELWLLLLLWAQDRKPFVENANGGKKYQNCLSQTKFYSHWIYPGLACLTQL